MDQTDQPYLLLYGTLNGTLDLRLLILFNWSETSRMVPLPLVGRDPVYLYPLDGDPTEDVVNLYDSELTTSERINTRRQKTRQGSQRTPVSGTEENKM